MATGLRHAGAEIGRIASRTVESAAALAAKTGAKVVDISEIDGTEADMVIIAVADDAIADVVGKITPRGDAIFVHTAGSVAMSVFDPERFARHGVFYPMQTMSRELEVDWRRVPMFVEASSAEVRDRLMEYASALSDNVRELDSASRVRLHAAAVLSCNMVMYLWSLTDRVLADAGLDFETMRPLLEVTLERTKSLKPAEAVTGPARRGDLRTIRKHLEMLPPDVAETYRQLSQSLLKAYHPELTIYE